MYFNKKRARNISVGISQVQFKFWIEFFRELDFISVFTLIFYFFENPQKNYILTDWYLKQHQFDKIIEISDIYTGKKNAHYALKIIDALSLINRNRR